MSTARIFKSGNSQAVRLPKEFRFHVNEVEIFRRGEEIVLREPKRNLGQAFAALAGMPKDFMAEGRQIRRRRSGKHHRREVKRIPRPSVENSTK